jgi:hypothetical protein
MTHVGSYNGAQMQVLRERNSCALLMQIRNYDHLDIIQLKRLD